MSLSPKSICDLPSDVQRYIYIRTLMLRQPKQVLTKALKDDIESHHLLGILMKYFKEMLSDIDEHHSPNYYLGWLENELLDELNNHIPIMNGLTTSMANCFPGFTPDEIIFELEEERNSVYGHIIMIKKYWKHLAPCKRILLHDNYYMRYRQNIQ